MIKRKPSLHYANVADVRERLGERAAAQVQAMTDESARRALMEPVASHTTIANKMIKAAQTARDTNHIADAAQMVKPRKYHNEPCTGDDGQKFDSKKERRDYERLCREFGKENVVRQVSIPLLDGERIRPDFVLILDRYPDGSFRGMIMDSKGMETRDWKAKRLHLKDKHQLEIKTI